MSQDRTSTIDLEKNQFQTLGYQLIDALAIFFDSIDLNPISTKKTPSELQKILGDSSLPEDGINPQELLTKATKLLLDNSLFNGHPKFLGYITSSPAPLGALADLLAASINPNVGAHILSPMATEIEKQTVKWLAEFIGVSPTYGGILVSGGNMANFTAFLAGRTEKGPKDIKEKGISASSKYTVYCSKTTHTWIDKAMILFGLGTDSLRWIETTSDKKMDHDVLIQTIDNDLKEGFNPMMIIGTAGDVSTGVVDNLKKLSSISKTYDMWFHIDGAYGVPAAVIPSLKEIFSGLEDADSIALDPHKWLYSPLEAGCTLVKNPQHLINTFSSHPEYYNFSSIDGEVAQNFYEYGLQNSRGFRALKVWMSLQHIGRNGYEKLIQEDITLANFLYSLANNHDELEAKTHNLSITTFRYIPLEMKKDTHLHHDYLNSLNEKILNDLQLGGEAFLSNAVVDDHYCFRACVVNFRTTKKDMEEIITIIVQLGRVIHTRLNNVS